MIQAQEVRRGNIVQHGDALARIDTIIPDAFIRVILPDGDWKTVRWGDLSPIPLSPEKLEKCGFELREHTEDGDIWGNTNVTLIHGNLMDNSRAYFLNGYHNDIHLQWIHQLQNLWYLIKGQELEIKM